MLKIKKREQGVVSLEACIVLPIFLLLLLFFYGFIVFFTGHHILSHTLIQSAQSLSLDPYATERLSEDLEEEEGCGDLIEAVYAGAFTGGDKYFSSNEKWYNGENNELMLETVRNRFLGYLVGGGTTSEVESLADKKLKIIGVNNGLDGLDFSETEIVDGELIVTIKYKQEFIFNFQGLAAFDRKQSIHITLWT